MRKSWPIFVLFIVVVGIVFISCYTDPISEIKQQTNINIAAPSSTPQSQTGNSTSKDQGAAIPPKWRRLFAWPGGVETLGIMFTLIFIAWQALLTRQAIDAAEAASQIELRAYLVVSVNSGTIQDREKGTKFDANPTLLNTGKTPAHNVRYRTNSTILTFENAKSFSFPPGDEEIGGYVVGVGQGFAMLIVLRDFCDPQDVEGIATGSKASLYTWGVVSYDDAFGNPQTTEFCHRVWFYKDVESDRWKVNGNYMAGRNKAT